MSNLRDVLTEWQTNFEFRQQFKKNPEAALKNAGFEMSDEDLAKIRKMIAANEQLDDRINK
jgi:hypothetical protein